MTIDDRKFDALKAFLKRVPSIRGSIAMGANVDGLW
jgi:hypothetical protein